MRSNGIPAHSRYRFIRVHFEGWGFKRMPVYEQCRSKALIFLADVLDTLTTLARLVREATQASLAVT
jgi:hypothetical protein